jgi:hypothetical protein
MYENLEEEAYKLAQKFRKISPALLMKKYGLTGEASRTLAYKIYLRQHLEAREEAKKVMDNF